MTLPSSPLNRIFLTCEAVKLFSSKFVSILCDNFPAEKTNKPVSESNVQVLLPLVFVVIARGALPDVGGLLSVVGSAGCSAGGSASLGCSGSVTSGVSRVSGLLGSADHHPYRRQ